MAEETEITELFNQYCDPTIASPALFEMAINRLIIGAEENGILKGLYQARYATEPGSGEEQRIDNQIAELSNNLSKGDDNASS
mgnify:CR=1 FL=1